MGFPYHYLTFGTFALSYYSSIVLIAFPRAHEGESSSFYALIFFAHVIAILWIKSFTRVMSQDPGFLERRHVESLQKPATPQTDVAMVSANEIIQTGVNDLAYCPTCDLMQPERTKHCSNTRRCVRRFDRYSHWLNNAIGIHNHKFFMMYIFYTALWTAFVAWMMVPKISDAWNAKDRTSAQAFDLYGGLVSLFVALFSIYYLFLNISWMAVNFTFLEYSQHIARLREFGIGYVNPYDVSNKVNIQQVMGPDVINYLNPWSARIEFEALSYPRVTAPEWVDEKERKRTDVTMGTAIEVMQDVRKKEMMV